ncbi:MAG: sugar ABC transporter permease [Treponema sp.]|jgi:multiple sugar transport system permease protein|nr:sugar ABC transporter permease [Treponema sp.]
MSSYYSGKRQLQEDIAGYLFISPWIIGFFAFSLIPIFMSLYFSFTNYDILGSPIFSGLANFKRMMTDARFWNSLQVTFTYAFISVPARLIFAFFIAALFKRASRMIRFYQASYYLPSLVGGSIAVAVIWRRMFTADGVVNTFLQAIGINSTVSWIGSADTALGVIMILAVWQFGSSMLIFLAGLRQIPKTYYEAASIDGAGWLTQFFRITLPQMTPIIFFNLIMQLINGFTVFSQAFIISGGRGDPQDSTMVYALYLYLRAFAYNEMGYGSALAWVLVLIIAVFTGLIFKTSDRWVYYES